MFTLISILAVVAWAALGIWSVVRGKLLRFPVPTERPVGAPEPIVYLFAGASVWLAGAFASALAYVLIEGRFGPEDELASGAIVGGAAQAGSLVMALGLFVLRPVMARRGAGVGATFAGRDLLDGLKAFALVCPMVLLAAFGAQQLATFVSELTGGSPPERLAHGTLRQLADPELMTHASWWALIAVVTIGAPITEELIFRGFAQTALTRMTGSHRVGIAMTTVLFVLVHVGIADWQAMIPLALLSVGLSAAYAKTGRLWVPIVVHAVFNGMNVVMAMAG